MDYVTRINLKTDAKSRKDLIDFCLGDVNEQYIAIGWSYIYSDNANKVDNYKKYYKKVRKSVKRLNHALNVFYDTKSDDLFWTRDLDGCYWICRAKDGPKTITEINMPIQKGKELDVGAVVPVEAYRYGLAVPGAIKSSFNTPRGGIAKRIYNYLIIEFSKFAFNKMSNSNMYSLRNIEELSQESKENFISNLPDFDLEELVISYIQIEHDYYLLSNSIANKSTTVKIEGELYSRNLSKPGKAVVQVKGPGYKNVLSAILFKQFIEDGYVVFLYANKCDACGLDNVVIITKEELESFYFKNKSILPDSITQWENIFKE
ncbi:MAG: hypothetical protein BWX78_01221 [Firmicutes bacterium ADurb.Bin099]|nr:MAG: hypothetical protein BWX78_01221 [Firmicutes bacterium ADurb.Bin099]